MFEADPPVTVVNLFLLPSRVQHQFFSFKLLEVYNHRPGLCMFRWLGTERSVAPRYSKFNLSEEFQLFSDKIGDKLFDDVFLNYLWDSRNACFQVC